MSYINKKLAVTAAASALLASLGLAVAQSNDTVDPTSAQQEQHVDVNGTSTNASGQQIYFFRDQGNSPETDPAAHLMLIKHEQPVPVAYDTTSTTTTTTVADASTPANDTVTTTMPAASDTSNTESGTDNTASQSTTTDNTPALAPKADRN